MSGAVFDASVLVKLVHAEPGTAAARDAFAECAPQPLAPDWAMLECSQALWRKARARELTAEQTRRRYEALAAIGLHLVDAAELAGAALSLGLTLQHPVYDCLYVALALAEGAPLVTADAKQREAAEAAGIEVLWIDSSR